MKRLLLLAFVVAISLPSFAQLSVGASAGYQLNGRVHGYYGTVNFKDNANYGVQVAYWIDQFTAVEFNYTGHSSDAIVEYPPGEGPVGTGQNWFQLGSIRSIGGYDAVKPFGTGSPWSDTIHF